MQLKHNRRVPLHFACDRNRECVKIRGQLFRYGNIQIPVRKVEDSIAGVHVEDYQLVTNNRYLLPEFFFFILEYQKRNSNSASFSYNNFNIIRFIGPMNEPNATDTFDALNPRSICST